jgi:CDP-diacylglycerol---serine O-phosphatidyltransferase
MGKRRRLDLRKTLFLLPNMITLSSIFCGFDSIRVSASAAGPDDYYKAALLIVFAMFFDILDGRVARATKTQSAFGLQIDSLADVLSFGAAPAVLVYQWTLRHLDADRVVPFGLIVSFVFIACGAIRLARFNVLTMGEQGKPTKPGKYIVGLPIPGAAGILVSIVVANHAAEHAVGGVELVLPILAVTLALSFLMVSTVRFRSFKDVRLNARTVLLIAVAVGSTAVVSYLRGPQWALVCLLGFYILLGILETLWQLPGRLRERAALAREAANTHDVAGRPSKPPPG